MLFFYVSSGKRASIVQRYAYTICNEVIFAGVHFSEYFSYQTNAISDCNLIPELAYTIVTFYVALRYYSLLYARKKNEMRETQKVQKCFYLVH